MDIETVLDVLSTQGHSRYEGEDVSQLEHALQAAVLAEAEAASPALVVAALLHDIGHLLSPASGAMSGDLDRDQYHEQRGAAALASLFDDSVCRPIALHVIAKRYLCVAETGYESSLSRASQHSLALQGGALTDAEAVQFLADPYAHAAIRLRRWDDQAKVLGLATPELDHFRPLLVAMGPGAGASG